MKGVRLGLCSVIAFAVLAFGAVEPRGQFGLEIGAVLLFLLWGWQAIRADGVTIRWSAIYIPMVSLAGYGLLQYLFRVSAYPYATRVELLRAVAYLLLCFVAAQCFPSTAGRRGFAWFLVVLAFSVSLLGIVQHFTSRGKLYWILDLPPGAIPFGPFQNSDHFAGFVELTVPMGLAMLAGGAVERGRVPLLGLFTVLPIGALAMTGSRGGAAGFLFELVLLALLLRFRGVSRVRVLVGVLTAVGALILWLGVNSRFESLESFSPKAVSQDRRVSMFRDAVQIFVHHPWTGTGLGTFRAAFPQYESYYDGRIVEHAHNDYLELLAETGLVGGLCGAAFLVLLCRNGWAYLRSDRRTSDHNFVAGALAACGGLLLHSLVDFNLHIPANALLFLILATLAASGGGLRRGLPAEQSAHTDRLQMAPRENA